MKRRALAAPTPALEGRGIHSGEPSRLRVLPAPAGSGLRFRRADLPDRPALGREDLVTDASEGGRTTLRRGGTVIQTVEHVAAAVWGLGLDDALVEVEGAEPPAGDGSALPYVQALQAAGIEETDEERPALRPQTVLAASEGSASVASLPAATGLRLSYLLDYPGEPLAQGSLEVELTPESFAAELAPARTFCPAAQVEKFLAMGWGRGADATNTLVLEGAGVRDNQLRFADEPVRHKMLDLVGDLAFAGGELVAELRASRSGHRLNRRLLGKILALCEVRNGGQSVLDVNEIRKLLPHRYPFLLVDRVVEFEPGKRAVGIKNLSVNEPFFQGHFPEAPVMPGVLQIEALAQVGGILLQSAFGDEGVDKIAVLASVDKAKLRRAVLPGDQLVMEVTLDRFRGSFGQIRGRATVDGQVAAEAIIRFAVVSPDNVSGGKKS